MPLRLVAVTYDARDPEQLAAFWGGVLGRTAKTGRGPERGVLLPGDDRQVGLRFVAGPAAPPGERDLHLHLTSDGAEGQDEVVQRVLDLGGRHLDVGQLPEERHVVLADPEGNALCVIPPDSTFLAGCGPLGEVACDGSPEVGRFWSAALGWPLVWDQDGETAIQSPAGGTKLAWGGPPYEPKRGRNPQRFDLTADDLDAAVSELLALGATELGRAGAGEVVELADPDGNELRVLPA